MAYFCQQCGECCSVMGQVFSIVGQLDEFRYLLQNEYTGDTREVEVAPSLRRLFLESPIPGHWQDPCPFLRIDGSRGLAFCTVHQTRPDVCREYQCWRVLVLDREGRRVARVMEKRYLCLEDEGLRGKWEEFRQSLDTPDDRKWDEAVSGFFRERGYSVFQ
ncbi:MAG: Flagellin N-methylase [Methanoregulaceae archaeon PtaB.Bin056]|nr:MAG: Flagellin N-methylase [Methanoregulaceae archaeon PtaB.Bin056]